MSADRAKKLPINVSRHLAARRAMGEVRQRISVIRETFGDQGHISTVLVGGECYVVDDVDLRRLRAGSTPAELELYPVTGD